MKKWIYTSVVVVTAVVIYLLSGPSFVKTDNDFPVYPDPERIPWYEERLYIHRWTPYSTRSAEDMPAWVDNSQTVYFPPLFTQKGNSCSQAAAVGYLFTYEMNRQLGRPADIEANRFSYLWTWNFLNGGKNNGSWAEYGLRIIHGAGAMPESLFPQQSTVGEHRWANGYDKYFEAMHYGVDEILSINSNSSAGVDRMKRYLWDKGNGTNPGGLLTITAYSSGWEIDSHYDGPSGTGYKALLRKPGTEGAHTLTIVGYDDLVEFTAPDGILRKGAFITVNTLYGPLISDNARLYIPYYFFSTERSSNTLGHYAVGIVPEYRFPKVVFKLKLKSASRNDIAIVMGVADKPYAINPSVYAQSTILTRQGGDHNMQGPGASEEIEVGLDFSAQVEQYESYGEPKYFVNIVKYDKTGNNSPAYIQHFSVLDYRDDPANPTEYVCDEIEGDLPLGTGANYFSVATTKVQTTSASPYHWYDSVTMKLYGAPFVIRTSDGRYAKIRFDYNERNRRMEITYVFQPDGSRNL